MKSVRDEIEELKATVTKLQKRTVTLEQHNNNISNQALQKSNLSPGKKLLSKKEKKEKRRVAREKAIEWGKDDKLRSKIMREVTKIMKDKDFLH